MARNTSGEPGATAAVGRNVAGKANAQSGAPVPQARSVAIATSGVRTGQDFAALMTALMSDIIEERISPNVANAAINAGGKLLKVVEMQYKYSRPQLISESDKERPAFELGSAS
jgi:hypothetical protein